MVINPMVIKFHAITWIIGGILAVAGAILAILSQGQLATGFMLGALVVWGGALVIDVVRELVR